MSKPYRRPQQQKGYQRNKKFQKKNRKPSFDQLLRAEEVAKKAIKVASEICVFTNDNIKVLKI